MNNKNKAVYCSPREAAEILNTSYHNILRHLDEINHIRLGQKIFILKSSILPSENEK
ncbi:MULTISPECIES: helix-turn-helix domain-containing protein [unclassified Oceanispirochaeta]|uniref:helix-turn-helix domain-containing protein n=1 Tax=unclassified Oceanispirochaeta TaxID=2635722 RepID=UPI000E09BDE3|nr:MULTISPECIES: helix-turn-helix domain-containing protein [unclassified Oceanispirochaeta]MBF9018844.1 helix-turn-helix domain-containing protein [Oceanispirochaeta sp. M2]NPD75332.1 helix-turn-helix domain-containing protein [Oceanispirochaeta sp. M1]RDG28824.1 DNA-binding protein [Oceanispirochaeta sp. M1]